MILQHYQWNLWLQWSNLCIICRLALYPCGFERPAASSVLATQQCLWYNKPAKLTWSRNAVWQLQATVWAPLIVAPSCVGALKHCDLHLPVSPLSCVNIQLSFLSPFLPVAVFFTTIGPFFYFNFQSKQTKIIKLMWYSLVVHIQTETSSF